MNHSAWDRNTRTCTTTAAIWLCSKPVQTPRPTTEGTWLTGWPSTCSPPLSLLPQTAILVPASWNQCHRTQSPSCPGCREVFPGCPSGLSITAPLVRKPCVSDEPGCPTILHLAERQNFPRLPYWVLKNRQSEGGTGSSSLKWETKEQTKATQIKDITGWGFFAQWVSVPRDTSVLKLTFTCSHRVSTEVWSDQETEVFLFSPSTPSSFHHNQEGLSPELGPWRPQAQVRGSSSCPS